jgi:glycosyltransferase involved in cell wall biosynthesis
MAGGFPRVRRGFAGGADGSVADAPPGPDRVGGDAELMRRLLMICYYFPPLGGIGSVRALKFARYLPEFGWDPIITAPRDGAYYRDPTLHFDEHKIIRTPSLEASRLGKQIIGAGRDDTRSADVGRVLRTVRAFSRRWIYRPDSQIGWYPFAVWCGRKAMRERKCDAIFSSSFPITAHLVGRRLHREFGVPWFAEFRDLWTDLSQYDSRRREHLDRVTERSLLETATEVITVSQGYAKVLLDRGARRVSVITNGFDPSDFRGAPVSSRPLATYVGAYYPDRQDLGTAVHALGDLLQSGLLPGLRIRFVGEFPESLRATLVRAGLADAIECTGFVPHREALGHLEESRLLLLAGPVSGTVPRSKVSGNIASKVFEYLGSQRPILYVGEANSEVESIIRCFPGVACIRPGDAKGAREAILSLIAQGPTVDRGPLELYTRRSLTNRLAKLLDGASGRL